MMVMNYLLIVEILAIPWSLNRSIIDLKFSC